MHGKEALLGREKERETKEAKEAKEGRNKRQV